MLIVDNTDANCEQLPRHHQRWLQMVSEVMISAMVSDGTGGSGLASVMANVSMLDTEATAIRLR